MSGFPPKTTRTFKDSKTSCRNGKWTHEELEFSKILMEAFSSGLLPEDDKNAVEGMSLRLYLSKKLRCNPKRVSKKFECSNYNGKQLYARDLGYIDEHKKQVEDLWSRIARLQRSFEDSVRYLKAAQDAKQKDKGTIPSPVASAARVEHAQSTLAHQQVVANTSGYNFSSAGSNGSSRFGSQVASGATSNGSLIQSLAKDRFYLAMAAAPQQQQHHQRNENTLRMLLQQQPLTSSLSARQSLAQASALQSAAFPSLAQNMPGNASIGQMQAMLRHQFQPHEDPQVRANKRARFF